MLFNSFDFLIFFPIVFVIYYICPPRFRHIWLLITSYYFYMRWNPVYILLLFGCTLITYAGGLLIERSKRADAKSKETLSGRKRCLFSCAFFLLGVLAFFKYLDFILIYLNRILALLHIDEVTWRPDIVLPVGISFYTLQSLGYLIDVYRDDIYAERNFLRYALFVSFFPQLVAGPIERSKNLLVQLYSPKKLEYDNFRKGFVLIIYGLFCKMVIADRLAMIVDTVYGDPAEYGGFYILFATVCFSFQIYCDFYGYSTIARGAALMLGIRLVDNFNAPYFSRSVKEFWRRWHISLSYWFRDYLYIPLGGNRKGRLKKEGNLLLVFCISGLWHGASLGYIFWGFLNGLYQVVSGIFHDCRNKLLSIARNSFDENIKAGEGTIILDRQNRFSAVLRQRVVTFTFITFAWLFFRAGSLSAAMQLCRNMLRFNPLILLNGSLYRLGVEKGYFIVVGIAILILMLVDYQKYQGKDVAALLLQQGWWFRTVCIVGLVIATMLYGCYGEIYDTQQFIYFQF